MVTYNVIVHCWTVCRYGNDNDNGFVIPTSIDNLWQPIDLIRPTMKVALGVHIRNGSIRHVFPAVDISYDNDQDGYHHRNRGLCSVPRAHTWVDIAFLNSIGDYNRYELRVSSKKNDNDNDNDNEGDDNKWQQLLSSSSYSSNSEVISKAIERVVIFLAENDDDSDSNDDFGNGSNILHVILDTDNGDDGDMDNTNEKKKKKLVCEIPKSSHDLKVTMVEMYGNDQKIENTGYEDVDVAILQVTVTTTMSGSESDYLPDVYRPLFDDPKLKNPLYDNYKDRRKATNNETKTTKADPQQAAQPEEEGKQEL